MMKNAIESLARQYGVLGLRIEHGSDVKEVVSDVAHHEHRERPLAPWFPQLQQLIHMLRQCEEETEIKAILAPAERVAFIVRSQEPVQGHHLYVAVLYWPGVPMVKSLRRFMQRIVRTEMMALSYGQSKTFLREKVVIRVTPFSESTLDGQTY